MKAADTGVGDETAGVIEWGQQAEMVALVVELQTALLAMLQGHQTPIVISR